jgi:hypothetical protein
MESTENLFSIIANFVIGGETTCPQSCSLAMDIVLSPVYTAVTWQWVFMSKYDIVCPNKFTYLLTPESVSYIHVQRQT